jgi:hypothetical protein
MEKESVLAAHVVFLFDQEAKTSTDNNAHGKRTKITSTAQEISKKVAHIVWFCAYRVTKLERL